MFWILAALTFVSAFTMVIAGSLSLLRNANREEHRWFFLLALALSIWIIVNFLGSNLSVPVVTEIFVKFDFSFALISCWLFLQFVATLLAGNPYYSGKKQFLAQRSGFRILSVVVVGLLCVAIASGYVLHASLVGRELHVKTVGGFWAYIVTVTCIVYYAITILLSGWRHISKKYREGLDMILIGFGAFILTNVASNLIFPYVFSDRIVIQELNIVGYVGVVILVICIYLAMTIKKLFDIRLNVFRGLVYTLTTMVVGVVYITPIMYVVEVYILDLHPAWYTFVFTVLFTSLAASSYIRVKNWFDVLTRKLFFRDAYDSAAVIGELNRVLVSTYDLNSMLQQSADLIAKNLRIDYCLFVLKDAQMAVGKIIDSGFDRRKFDVASLRPLLTEKYTLPTSVAEVDYLSGDLLGLKATLAKNNISVVIRLSAETKRNAPSVGYMVLGYKKNGNPYNSQDIQTLKAIGDVMVIAIQNSLQFEEIKNFNTTLKMRVEEATQKLRRTNAKLQALDETKDDFISMASHQLRTPLTSIKGYLSMVLEEDAGKVTPLQRKMLNQAFISSQRMVFLIADLLNVSRLKTGKFTIEPTSVNLAKIISDEVTQLKETAKDRSLELTYDRPSDFPALMIDETKIRQVVMNFIDNAIYYTPAGGKIAVELTEHSDAVTLKITDTGIGVPKAEQPHLFTKFYRANNARQARPDGTGLGLFMAKKVIIAQGGAVIFESREGKGSTFGFIFPKSKLTAAAEKSVAKAATS